MNKMKKEKDTFLCYVLTPDGVRSSLVQRYKVRSKVEAFVCAFREFASDWFERSCE